MARAPGRVEMPRLLDNAPGEGTARSPQAKGLGRWGRRAEELPAQAPTPWPSPS